jgi:hypothetical protein
VSSLSEFHGHSPDKIVSALPHLSLAQVHAALAYYFDHREDIVEEMRQDQEFVARIRPQTGPGPLESFLSGQDADRDSIAS